MEINFNNHPILFILGLLSLFYIWLSIGKEQRDLKKLSDKYLNEIKNIKYDNIESIEVYKLRNKENQPYFNFNLKKFYLLETIQNEIIFKKLLLSLKTSKYTNDFKRKKCGYRLNTYFILLKMITKDNFFLEIEDCSFKARLTYITPYIINKNNKWDYKNIMYKNTQLKSILKSLNLPNWKEKQASNGN